MCTSACPTDSYALIQALAGLLAHSVKKHDGFFAFAAFPVAQWLDGENALLTVAGAATDLVPDGYAAPCSLLSPLRGSLRAPTGIGMACAGALGKVGEQIAMVEKIAFSPEEKADILRRIQAYFRDERDEVIGEVAAEMILEFFSTEIGGFYYNRGLYDAQTLLRDKIAEITDAIFELEKPE